MGSVKKCLFLSGEYGRESVLLGLTRGSQRFSSFYNPLESETVSLPGQVSLCGSVFKGEALQRQSGAPSENFF